jgi:hypothetical protein
MRLLEQTNQGYHATPSPGCRGPYCDREIA